MNFRHESILEKLALAIAIVLMGGQILCAFV